jgi:hypothetical protein
MAFSPAQCTSVDVAGAPRLTPAFVLPVTVKVQDPKGGFLSASGSIAVSATVLVLEESMQFARDADGAGSSAASGGGETLRCRPPLPRQAEEGLHGNISGLQNLRACRRRVLERASMWQLG